MSDRATARNPSQSSPHDALWSSCPMLLGHIDRLGRAHLSGFPNQPVQIPRRGVLEQDDRAVIVILVEHLGYDEHAVARTAASFLVDSYIHVGSMSLILPIDNLGCTQGLGS